MNPIKWLTTFLDSRTTGEIEPEVKSTEIIQKDLGVLGGFFESSSNKLSDTKTISSKLLEANVDWVYRNNDVIAKEVAQIEFELYQVGIKDSKFEYTEISDHPLLELLDRFNETTTKSDGLYMAQSHKKLTGNSYWYLDGKGADINNIFLLQPDNVELELGDFTGASARMVEAYVYKAVVDGKEVSKTYDPDQIIHIKTPNPNNPYMGYGAVEAAADVIDLDWLTTDLGKKFFKNGAITNFILSTEGKLQEEQLKRLKAEFKSAYGGSKNAFKTMILGGGLKPTTIQASNKDMDFMAQLEWYRDKIMVLFGNTKASLGIIDDVNRASHESSIISWKRNSVLPEMQAIVNALNEYLVPRYGNNLLLGFCDPVPENRSAKLEEMKAAVEAKIISKNEARELLGYDTVEGEEYDEVPDALQNVDTDKILRKRGWFKKLKDYRVYKEIGRDLAKAELKKKKRNTIVTVKTEPVEEKIHERFTNEQVLSYVDKQLGAVEQVEGRLQNKIEQFVLSVKEQALANYPEKQPKQYSKALIDENEFMVRAELDFAPLLRDVAILAGNEALDLIDEKLQYFGFDYEPTIRTNVRKFTQSMLDTEQDKMVEIIKNGIEAGKSIPNIRREMSEAFDQLSKIQAERISRTEVIRTSNEAAIDSWIESGVVEGKQWFTAEDGRVDSECAALNGKIIMTLKGDFYKKESEFENGNPPLHPNCRCVILPVLDAEKAFDTESLAKIQELESKIDKRTKEYREIKKANQEQEQYIKSLEKLLNE